MQRKGNRNSVELNEDAKAILDDRIKKDNKHLPLSSSSIVPTFLVHLFIVFPIWLMIILPSTLIALAGKYVMSLFGGKKKRNVNLQGSDAVVSKEGVAAPRKYDLVIYGATGFTGRMCALYIAKQYGAKSFKWAVAGRRKDALEAVRAEAAGIDSGLSSLPIIIADSSDADSLKSLVTSTKVVISTTGPFAKYGSLLVKLCAENGTHYCDITGETDWVREMVDKYDDTARKSGARIVNMCGHDCAPWDLVVMECAKKLKKQNENLVEVHCYDEIRASASGGTIATLFHSLEDRVVYKASLGFDPLLKNFDGKKSENKLIVRNQSFLGYSKEYSAYVGPFVMASVMANCVRRSNALNNYSPKLVYQEAEVYPSFMAGFVSVLRLIVFGTSLFNPLFKWLLASFILPKPGEGPSEKSMDKGWLKITAIGTGSNKGQAKAVIYFPTDPGYRDTARMLVESGLVLALEADKIKVGGGILTPASCQGDLLTTRLVETGSSFYVEE